MSEEKPVKTIAEILDFIYKEIDELPKGDVKYPWLNNAYDDEARFNGAFMALITVREFILGEEDL